MNPVIGKDADSPAPTCGLGYELCIWLCNTGHPCGGHSDGRCRDAALTTNRGREGDTPRRGERGLFVMKGARGSEEGRAQDGWDRSLRDACSTAEMLLTFRCMESGGQSGGRRLQPQTRLQTPDSGKQVRHEEKGED